MKPLQRALALITKALPSFGISQLGYGGLRSVAGSGGWFSIIRERFAGAWQRNITLDRRDGLMSNSTIYACTTRIANDISKLPINLVELTGDIWNVVKAASPFWPVLRKPNNYQNRIQFYVCWLLSKLMYGNTYVLKIRDERGIVIAMHVLNPTRVKVAVTPSGKVWYRLSLDELVGIPQEIALPASEIIHDLMNPLFHPLCGVPPLFAAALTSTQTGRIQHFAAQFYANMSRPSGILTSPGELSTAKAQEYKEAWETNFSGENLGRIAVAGGGLKFEPIGWPAQQSQLIEQLRWGVEDIARAYGMPLHKIGAGPVPTSNNVEALNQQYYDDCLQPHIEAIELCLDEGLGCNKAEGRPVWTLGTEFDLDNLLRMDSATQIDSLVKAAGGPIYKVDEARLKRNLAPIKGGNTIYMQQQNWPIEQLAERPPPTLAANEAMPVATKPDEPDDEPNEAAKALFDCVIAKFNEASIMKYLAHG